MTPMNKATERPTRFPQAALWRSLRLPGVVDRCFDICATLFSGERFRNNTSLARRGPTLVTSGTHYKVFTAMFAVCCGSCCPAGWVAGQRVSLLGLLGVAVQVRRLLVAGAGVLALRHRERRQSRRDGVVAARLDLHVVQAE